MIHHSAFVEPLSAINFIAGIINSTYLEKFVFYLPKVQG
jgi:hypothetical protein